MSNELSEEKLDTIDDMELPSPLTTFATQALDGLNILCKYIHEQPEILD
jgi:hypothetical protein